MSFHLVSHSDHCNFKQIKAIDVGCDWQQQRHNIGEAHGFSRGFFSEWHM